MVSIVSFMPFFISPNILPCFCACFLWATLTLCHYTLFLATHFCCKAAHVFTLNFSLISTRKSKQFESHGFCQSIIPKTSENIQKLLLSSIVFLSELPLRDHISLAWYLFAGISARSIYRRSHFFSRFLSPFVLNLDSWSRSFFQRFLFWSKVSTRFVFCNPFLLINCKYPPCLGCRFRHHFGIFVCFWFSVNFPIFTLPVVGGWSNIITWSRKRLRNFYFCSAYDSFNTWPTVSDCNDAGRIQGCGQPTPTAGRGAGRVWWQSGRRMFGEGCAIPQVIKNFWLDIGFLELVEKTLLWQ